MFGCLTAQKRIPTTDLTGDLSSRGFVGTALRVSGRTALTRRTVAAHNTRRDFIQALQTLGARSGRYRLGSDDATCRTISVNISCPYQTWVKLFGKPTQVQKHRKSPTGMAIHLWKHQCEDGPVTCIGQLSERMPGLRWVVVMRVGLYG
jgi:hypothetical protein